MTEKIFFAWQEEDFQGHPDLNIISFDSEQDVPVGCEIVEEVRRGRGYALSDGLYAFPGDQHVTRVITEN